MRRAVGDEAFRRERERNLADAIRDKALVVTVCLSTLAVLFGMFLMLG